METKIWTEYYDWLTWQKKHKHLNLNIDEAVNAYKKEFRLWEESERVRLVNEQLYRLYTEGHTTSAAGGGGESPSGLNSLLSFRFAGVDLGSVYGNGDEITSWTETANRATLTKQGAGSVTYNQTRNSALVTGDGAYLGVNNTILEILNPFLIDRAITIIWHGIINGSQLAFGDQLPIFNIQDNVNSSKLDVFASAVTGDGSDDRISFAAGYQDINNALQSPTVLLTSPSGDISAGPTMIILQFDTQDAGIIKLIVTTDAGAVEDVFPLSILGASISPNPINFRVGGPRSGVSVGALANQEVYEIRAYDKILTNTELSTVVDELNTIYNTTVTKVS
jgi:hypothetical protein